MVASFWFARAIPWIAHLRLNYLVSPEVSKALFSWNTEVRTHGFSINWINDIQLLLYSSEAQRRSNF